MHEGWQAKGVKHWTWKWLAKDHRAPVQLGSQLPVILGLGPLGWRTCLQQVSVGSIWLWFGAQSLSLETFRTFLDTAKQPPVGHLP